MNTSNKRRLQAGKIIALLQCHIIIYMLLEISSVRYTILFGRRYLLSMVGQALASFPGPSLGPGMRLDKLTPYTLH